jgi:hypothetical protein
MVDVRGIHATESQIQDRCRMLADADLVGFVTEDEEMVELTTWGRLYLEGKIDVENHRWPRHPTVMK